MYDVYAVYLSMLFLLFCSCTVDVSMDEAFLAGCVCMCVSCDATNFVSV